MPRQASELMIENEGLLQICEYLHMTVTGSREDWGQGPERLKRYIKILETAIQHWNHNDSIYDNAVKHLIEATLQEVWKDEYGYIYRNQN